MNASEKLKRLSFWQWRKIIREVVAVVKAAEVVSETERTGTLPDFLPLAVALTSLDEVLS